MSRKPENTFIASVHKYLPPELYRMKNSNMFNSGIADVWYDGRRDLWLEYKFLVLPKRADTVIDLVSGKQPAISALQQMWLRDRHNNGRQVGVVVGCKAGGVWFPGVSWAEPITTKEFIDDILPRPKLAQLIVDLTGGVM